MLAATLSLNECTNTMISWRSLQVCANSVVQEAGISFLLSAARVERTRGLMALRGAFGVLVECASRPTCQTDVKQKCSLLMDALVKEADQPVKKLLEAYQSRSICKIGLFRVFSVCTHLTCLFFVSARTNKRYHHHYSAFKFDCLRQQ